MASIESVTLDVADPTAVNRFYTAAFGLGTQVRLRASEAPTAGFRGFTLSLTVSLRKSLTDPPASDVTVKVGDLQNFTVALNATRRVAGNPELDAFLLDRLHDGGKFYVVLSGTTDGKTDLVVDVNLHASMGYETGLF